MCALWDAWLALSAEHATLDLGVLNSSPTLGVRLSKNKIFFLKMCVLCLQGHLKARHVSCVLCVCVLWWCCFSHSASHFFHSSLYGRRYELVLTWDRPARNRTSLRMQGWVWEQKQGPKLHRVVLFHLGPGLLGTQHKCSPACEHTWVVGPVMT